MNSTIGKLGFFIIFTLALNACQQQQPQIQIVPLPQEVVQQAGTLTISPEATISFNTAALGPLAELIISDISKLYGISLNLTDSDGTIHLEQNSINTNGYEIEISNNVIISGSDYNTLAQGVTSFLQMTRLVESKIQLPKVRMTDYPASSFRSVMIDVARQVVDISTLKQSIDLCRLYKIPFLQLHIADDQAFCFPSATYPELATPGHHYTLDELHDLVEYATVRGITIIPELDGPGHSSSIRKAKPEVFGSTAYYTVDMTMDTMYDAMAILIKEMLEVFHTSPYFHIGADEAYLSPAYLNAPHVKRYLNQHKLEGEDLKRAYVVRTDAIIKALGKKTMAWESFKASNKNQRVQIPNDILVNAWETLYEHPDTLIQHGFDIVNTSWKPHYTVRSHRWHPEYIYNFPKNRYANHWNRAPSYNAFDIPESDKTIGGQMCAWEQFDVQIIEGLRNRLPAFSENYWTIENPTFENYLNRYKATDQLFEKLIAASTIHFKGLRGSSDRVKPWNGNTIPNPSGEKNNSQHFFDEQAVATITPIHPEATIRYTTDGTKPNKSSKEYTEPLIFNQSTHLRYVVYHKDQPIGYNQYLLEHRPIKAILEGLSDTARAPEPYWYQHVYTDTLQLALYLDDPDAEIRFTLDGSEPNADQELYRGPIWIFDDEPIIVRAQAFKDNMKYGDEWRPGDYYDNVLFYQPRRWFKFKKAGTTGKY